MILMIRHPFFSTDIAKLRLANTLNKITPNILMYKFLTRGTRGAVIHLKVYIGLIGKFAPVFLIETFAGVVVFLPAFRADQVGAGLTFDQLEEFFDPKTCVAAVPRAAFADFYGRVAVGVAAA